MILEVENNLNNFSDELNHILIEVYHNILRLEEISLKKNSRINLTINEMHLIECVGKAGDAGITVSELAENLHITRPSATIAVNKLERKGYLVKNSCRSDGRVVFVTLTANGRRIDAYHKYYHRNMVKAISEGFTEEEKKTLLRTVDNLNNFFKKSIGD